MLLYTKIAFLIVVLAFILFTATAKPTRRYRYDAEFLDSEIQRIKAGRAGQELDPHWTVTRSRKNADEKEGDTVAENKNPEEEEEDSGTEEGEGDDYTSSEEIEITCAPGKGWHLRGQRCVPLNCPGGAAERDFNTGECLYVHQPKGGRFNKPFQQWNDLNHVYRSSPMSTHFVRSMIMMRKG